MFIACAQLYGEDKEAEYLEEPREILTLGQSLALTLMHNPELKVFSLETRAAQARELQAGLRPIPNSTSKSKTSPAPVN